MNRMQGIAALICLLMLTGFGSGYAEEEATGFFDSQGSPNGDFILAALDKEKGGDVGDFGITLYVSGVVDAMTAFHPNLWPELYPKLSKGEIAQRVKSYYENNPSQRHRRVVDVILSGSR
ncbi:MAG: hypothetical protein WC530_01520 [Candidatus Omnitrophota bacterium]|jgi:hypothetical protein